MHTEHNLNKYIATHIESVKKMTDMLSQMERSFNKVVNCLRGGNKILICGNGGSAADAQHLAGELVVKYSKVRAPLPAIALSVDTSIITAAGNDFDYSKIFSRQIDALGKDGDLLIAFTTSGNSKNVNFAIAAALEKKMSVIVLTGQSCEHFISGAEYIIFPNRKTSVVQEMHIIYYHLLCEVLDEKF